MLNMEWQDLDFEIPALTGRQWLKVIDTALLPPEDVVEPGQANVVSDNTCHVVKRSVVVLVSRTRSG